MGSSRGGSAALLYGLRSGPTDDDREEWFRGFRDASSLMEDKSRIVHVFRLNGTVLTVPRDEVLFTLGREEAS